jgi:uncharacterized protein YegP (UPF0339 family)
MDQFYGQQYKRKDGKYAWRVRSYGNDKIVATDGAQGYERSIDCANMFRSLFPNLELQRVN